MSRPAVRKTYKLYIGGAFVRSESGRSMTQEGKGGFVANYCQASRKDLRDAVKAARGATTDWSGRTAYNRGQILYRIAEMLESRREEFAGLIALEAGLTALVANKEVEAAIDRVVYYCGWADKLTAVLGSVNPVATEYFDFSFPEPTGVVGIVAEEGTPLIGLVSQVAPVIVSGNTCVVLSSDRSPLSALEFGEVLATSDLPGGVVNLLTGSHAELLPHLAKHMDVNAIDYRNGDADVEAMLINEGARNLKRVRLGKKRARAAWLSDRSQGLDWIERFVETKTVWHPIGV